MKICRYRVAPWPDLFHKHNAEGPLWLRLAGHDPGLRHLTAGHAKLIDEFEVSPELDTGDFPAQEFSIH